MLAGGSRVHRTSSLSGCQEIKITELDILLMLMLTEESVQGANAGQMWTLGSRLPRTI
jgi:hypothetical protein